VLTESAEARPLDVMDWVNAFALAVNEENAAGGRVVTAPTNGAAGIVPAVIAYYTRFEPGASDEGVVRFLGFVAPVQSAIEEAAAVVVPSLGEGFGMVALEAMERARPVIASAVGGLPEIVAHGETGLVVPPGDAPALAEAIAELAVNLEHAAEMGRAGRGRALSEFPPERCVERIEELYRAALASDGA
jgi:glycosyltransferase involved in cell wall biosynthesis